MERWDIGMDGRKKKEKKNQNKKNRGYEIICRSRFGYICKRKGPEEERLRTSRALPGRSAAGRGKVISLAERRQVQKNLPPWLKKPAGAEGSERVVKIRRFRFRVPRAVRKALSRISKTFKKAWRRLEIRIRLSRNGSL